MSKPAFAQIDFARLAVLYAVTDAEAPRCKAASTWFAAASQGWVMRVSSDQAAVASAFASVVAADPPSFHLASTGESHGCDAAHQEAANKKGHGEERRSDFRAKPGPRSPEPSRDWRDQYGARANKAGADDDSEWRTRETAQGDWRADQDEQAPKYA